MELSKSLKKTLMVGMASLMVLGVGASSASNAVNPVHARAHRHHHYRHHHESWRTRRAKARKRARARRRRARRRRAERHYRAERRMAAKYRWWTIHIYDNPKINFVNQPTKLHKNLWSRGYLDGSPDDNVSPMNKPSVNMHHVYSIYGHANNYRLGWIGGYVNGIHRDGYVPVHHSLNDYIKAMKAYHKLAKTASTNDGATEANSNHGYLD